MNKSCDDSSNKFWGRKCLFTSSFLCSEFSLIFSGRSISLCIFIYIPIHFSGLAALMSADIARNL